jgi:hypothetical protein
MVKVLALMIIFTGMFSLFILAYFMYLYFRDERRYHLENSRHRVRYNRDDSDSGSYWDTATADQTRYDSNGTDIQSQGTDVKSDNVGEGPRTPPVNIAKTGLTGWIEQIKEHIPWDI